MEDILLPHETMIRLAGSKALMPGYHAVHGTKCVANSEILNDILRDYLGFDGMVVAFLHFSLWCRHHEVAYHVAVCLPSFLGVFSSLEYVLFSIYGPSV